MGALGTCYRTFLGKKKRSFFFWGDEGASLIWIDQPTKRKGLRERAVARSLEEEALLLLLWDGERVSLFWIDLPTKRKGLH